MLANHPDLSTGFSPIRPIFHLPTFWKEDPEWLNHDHIQAYWSVFA